MIESYARTAFANGYAEVGEDVFPMPMFAAEWSAAAVAMADGYEMAGLPQIDIVLEVSRLTGRRAAVMATMVKQRKKLDDRWAEAFAPIWAELNKWAAPKIVSYFITPKEAEQDPKDIVRRVLGALPGALGRKWRDKTQAAMIEGAAQGSAMGEMWIAATDAGAVMPDYGVAFDTAMAALANLDKLPEWLDPESWQAQQLDGAVYQLGIDLTNAIENGATGDELLALIEEDITGDDSTALLMLDNALSAASTQGALALYDSEGVQFVDVFTAEDPCPECEEAAAGNPWPIDEAPDIPLHPRCRCAIAAH